MYCTGNLSTAAWGPSFFEIPCMCIVRPNLAKKRRRTIPFTILILVGYNDREMLLDGQFSYDNENQRALPFNVHINEISGEGRTFSGANSE